MLGSQERDMGRARKQWATVQLVLGPRQLWAVSPGWQGYQEVYSCCHRGELGERIGRQRAGIEAGLPGSASVWQLGGWQMAGTEAGLPGSASIWQLGPADGWHRGRHAQQCQHTAAGEEKRPSLLQTELQ